MRRAVVSPYGHRSYGCDAVQADEALCVVEDIGHTDLGRGAIDADGADEHAYAALLLGEDILDTGADL